MSIMAMGTEAGLVRTGDHLIGEVAGQQITALVVTADPVEVDDLVLVHFILLDDLGVIWDLIEHGETVMTVMVAIDD